ncbi:MAG: class I SAM-dependent methyltransferase [Desulfobacterales bacterium]
MLKKRFFVKALRASGMLPEKAKILDFGAGSGLLVRFLRDEGFDAFGYDKYSETPFCKNVSFKNVVSIADKKFDLIIALEVTEHLLRPQETLKQLVSLLSKKGIVFLSTTCYDKDVHDENWDYLISQGGQHINFASQEGLRILANSQNLSTMFMPHEISLLCREKSQASKLSMYKSLFFYRLYIVVAKFLGLLNFKNCENDNQLIYETIVKDYK